MRLKGHAILLMVLGASVHVWAQPLVPLPLPGRFTDLQQSSSGALLVAYGNWSEYGGARLSMLRLNGRWLQVPAGAAFEWRDWLVFEGLFPLPHANDEATMHRSPWDGGTRVVTVGTDDAFAHRVVLVHGKSGRIFEAPWDSLAPVPLAKGDTWLVRRCPVRPLADGGVDEPMELVAWTPRTGRTRVIGQLPGEAGASCGVRNSGLSVVVFPDGGFVTPYGSSAFAYAPVITPSRDGALARLVVDGGTTRWVQLDANGRVTRTEVDAGIELSASPPDAGALLKPLRGVDEAFHNVAALRTSDGGVMTGRSAAGGAPFPLTPSLGAGFAIFEGLVFSDEGVFTLPAGQQPR